MSLENRTPVFVVGYPRSGSTHLSWLLGDALNSPVERYRAALPIAAEGADRPGDYVVHQLHLYPEYGEYPEVVPNARTFAVDKWRGEKFVYITRDPRDVIVSARHYWGAPDIRATITGMLAGKFPFPLDPLRNYRAYMLAWMDEGLPIARTRYETLHSDTSGELRRILDALHLPAPDDLTPVIKRQEFNAKRSQIERDGDNRPHGKVAQLHAMRRGMVGDWRLEFRRADGRLLQERAGDVLRLLGYEDNPDWWKELPE